jgi:hypothetical protein
VEVVEAQEVPRKPKPVMATADDEVESPRTKRRNDDEEDRPRSKRRDDNDDEDSDEDDRPRKKRRNDDEEDRPRRRLAKKAGLGAGVIAGIVLGSLLLLGGIGYGVYALVSGSGPKAAAPAGWKEYTLKDGNFKGYFPKEPQLLGSMQFGAGKNPFAGVANPIGGGNPFGGGGNPFGGGGNAFGAVPANIGEYMPESMSSYVSGDFNDPVHIDVQVMRYASKVPSLVRDQYANMPSETRTVMKGFDIEVKSVRWLGERGTEMVMPTGVMRTVVVDKAIVIATISGLTGRAKKEEEAGFFDNFQVLK